MLLFSLLQAGCYHYFEENKVVALLRTMGQFGNMEVVFDTVNKKGMAMMQKKYMKQVGHADAQMFFYVDSAKELAAKIGGNAKVIAEEPYYRHIPRNGLNLSYKAQHGGFRSALYGEDDTVEIVKFNEICLRDLIIFPRCGTTFRSDYTNLKGYIIFKMGKELYVKGCIHGK